jgi:Flp pilus assembly protein TadD
MAARIAVLLIALAGAGYLIALERGARAADRVTGVALVTPDAARLRQAQALVRTARHVSPDTQPTLDLGIAQARAGDRRAAGASFAAVTRQEPRNARAWTLLCLIARRYDSDLAATACARERALAPPVPPAR